ncbi:uncharacterized protein BROUX77_007061 [Berkeleyomyces rouxiae]|uniref:uncharacterized protein n=1 Tax=Berkeleyomyces rouxiae TaxID=2035830 RepID=UPI003B7F32A0
MITMRLQDLAHVYDALRKDLDVTHSTMAQVVAQKYTEAMESMTQFPRSGAMKEWVTAWVTTMHLCQEHSVPQMATPSIWFKDLKLGLDRVLPTWSANYTVAIAHKIADGTLTVDDVAANLKTIMAISSGGVSSEVVMYAQDTKTANKRSATEAGLSHSHPNPKSQITCGLCSGRHSAHKCWYFNKATRPSHWRPNSTVSQRIKAAKSIPHSTVNRTLQEVMRNGGFHKERRAENPKAATQDPAEYYNVSA